MSASTQLLASFSSVENLDTTVLTIINSYSVAFGMIYVLENADMPHNLICTYNIIVGDPINTPLPEATISLHRKKNTNTLYTINALNLLVSELNGGKMDKKFVIQWEDYRNTILVTAFNHLKKINTKLNKIIKVDEFRES